MAARRMLSRNIATLTCRSSTPRTAALAARMPSSPASTSRIASRRLHATTQHLAPASAVAESYPMNHEKIDSPADTQNFLDNKLVDSQASQWIDLYDPATNNLVTRVPQSTDEELKASVDSAEKAFK
ncbi:hypothetical protein LTS18_000560, partial [Coniosporium uncinatum]